jgi:anti-anti-sigma regulatory factor
MASCEVVNGALVVTGNLDKASDPDFQSALEKYCASTDAERALDLTSVRWLNNTIAKMIIQSGTDCLEKGSKLRVLASRHVQQTLNLLGAQAYLTIEAAAKPVAPPVELEAPKAPSLVGLDDADLMMPGPSAPAPANPGASPSTPAAAPAASSSGESESKIMPAIRTAAPRPSGALASPTEELVRGAVLFRILQIDKRYGFIVNGQEVTGIVRERVGGSWVLVETSGRRKLLNLDVVEMVEIL